VLRTSARGHRLKVRLLEADYLDDTRQGVLTSGGWIRDGIEFNRDGERVAYWLFDQHPGAMIWGKSGSPISQRIPAKDVLHVYRQDRAGQMRGVSWFSSIAIPLQDLGEFQDAQLMRQKIAACFVAFRQVEGSGTDPASVAQGISELAELSPGLIQDIGMDETVTFGTPPDSGDFDPFSRSILRAAASGIGLTYEAMTGDLSNVNFSSARMGRGEMDKSISSWQWTMLIPQFLQPMAAWLIEGWQADLINAGLEAPSLAMIGGAQGFEWVPPHKILVDPTREIPSLIEGIRGGLFSLSGVVRSLGQDPERLFEDIAADNAMLDEKGLIFESDFRKGAGAPTSPATDRSDEDADRKAKPQARIAHAAPRQIFRGV
jgi:lambda family phage portal protein